MGNISKEDLFREIGEIDEAYVEEAERVRRRCKTAPWIRTMAAAASLLVCVGVGYGVLRLTDSSNNAASMSGGGAMENAEAEITYSMAEENGGGEMNGQTQEAAYDTGNSVGSGTKEAFLTDEEAFPEEGAAQDRAHKETGLPSQQPDSVGVSAEKEDTISDATRPLSTDPVCQEFCQASESEPLTWAAAREDAAYGKYVDVQVPEGYVYESGTRSQSALRVVWLKGMEEISISCHHADESVSDWLVNPDDPQEYDLGLYTIPWSESVPQELIQKVSNAVFYPGQITPEIVTARSYQVEEQGDVSGWRTDIGILYGDNVLVTIYGKGPSPEEIYALINLEN